MNRLHAAPAQASPAGRVERSDTHRGAMMGIASLHPSYELKHCEYRHGSATDG
jgi:hypothetical protein